MFQQNAMPDYKRLAQTPHLQTQKKLTEQIRLGSGRKDIRIKGLRPAIPHLQSDRRHFPSKPIQPAGMTANGQPPLQIPETPSQYPFSLARQVTSKYTTPRQFINKDDRPLTDRQVARLHRKQLGGEYHRSAQDELTKLLQQSARVGQQVLTHLRNQQQPQPPVTVPTVPTEPLPAELPLPPLQQQQEEEQEEKEYAEPPKPSKKKLLKQAQSDLTDLETKYPTMTKDEQKKLLKSIRTKYTAKKMANVNVLKKIITEQMEEWKA
jgi:hypothetical protein